jgi:DNA-binding NtrC family response regulator
MIVLYADDDVEDVEIFNEIINMINPSIQLIHAPTGEKALKILEDAALLPDYIFIDINMPGMNGKSCLAQIKSDQRFFNVPTIIYTTSGDISEVETLMSLGAINYIIKPNTVREAIDGLAQVLAREDNAWHERRQKA